MAPTPRVRAVRTDELGELHAIRLRALRESPDAFGSTYEAEVARDAESRGTWLARGLALIAEDADGWHGLAGARFDDDERVEIVSMWVTPGRRGQGIGAALLRAALDWARSGGAHTVRLGVAEGNSNAWSLYRSHGFVPTGEREPLVSNPTRDVVYLEFSLR